MMSDIFLLYVRLVRAAAAAGEMDLQRKLANELAALARWWDQFATVEVSSVDGISGQATLESAESVAAAIRAWHDAGAAAGDLAFWRQHVEHFRVPKAYALVIDTLLDRRDFVSAMALLVQWLSQAEEIPLVEEDYSFHDLALGWMEEVWRSDQLDPKKGRPQRAGGPVRSAASIAAAVAVVAEVSRLFGGQRRRVLARAAVRDGGGDSGGRRPRRGRAGRATRRTTQRGAGRRGDRGPIRRRSRE